MALRKKYKFNIKSEYIILILILLIATFLRFYNLGGPSLFNDELETLRVASYHSIPEMINLGIKPDVHPPGFQIMMYYVVHYLGDSQFILRLPTAIFGILSVLMIFFLGKYLYSEREGLIGSAITTFLWAPLYYSQEARAYSLLFLMAMLTTYLWLRIINDFYYSKPSNIKLIVLYLIFAFITEYIQYLGLFFIFLQGISTIIILIKKPKQLLKGLIIFAILGAVFLPWLPFMLEQLQHGAEWIKPPKILAFGYFLAFLYSLSPYILAIALILYTLLIVHVLKKGPEKTKLFISPDLLLILWLIVPFAIIFIKSVVSRPALTYYSLIFTAPAAYLLFARAITTLNIKKTFQNILAVAIVGIMFYQLIFDFNYYGQPYKDHIMIFNKRFKKRTKEQFKEAAEYLRKNDNKYPNSLIISHAWFGDYFNYYFDKSHFQRRVDINVWGSADTNKIANLEKTKQSRYIWILRGHKELDSLFIDYFNRKYALINYKKFVGADVWLYKRKHHLKQVMINKH